MNKISDGEERNEDLNEDLQVKEQKLKLDESEKLLDEEDSDDHWSHLGLKTRQGDQFTFIDENVESDTESLEGDKELAPAAKSENDKDQDFLEESGDSHFSAEGTELESFETAQVEEAEFIEDDRIISVVESLLFSTDRPMSISHIKQAFKGTTATSPQIRRALDHLAVEYAGAQRGISIEEINSGFQLRTKSDNMPYLRQLVKTRPFKLSGPALEVMAITAYKQPVTKSDIDEIRGVESGHLLRGLMEKGLVHFAGKSELPGKPMLYETTRKFLEIFGLRNIRELPSLAEIDELIPEGIGEAEDAGDKEKRLEDITGDLSRDAGMTYSEGEHELLKISTELETISTSTSFFEEEKNRAKAKRDQERAQDIRDALTMNESVEAKDVKWLERYEKSLLATEEEQKALETEVDAAFDQFFDTH